MAETTQNQPQAPIPNPELKKLDVLVGTWNLSGHESGPEGEIHGQTTYEWMDGGFFLVQHVDFTYIDHPVKGTKFIGYERKWGETEPSQDCTSHLFDNNGNHFTYVYEITDDTLIIWGEHKNSPAYFKGTFSPDKNTLTGAWTWPDGGYSTTSTRVQST